MNIFKDIVNLLLPPRCAVCGKVLDIDKGLCDECIAEFDFIKDAVCYRCGRPFGNLSDGRGHGVCASCLHRKRHLFRFSRSAFGYDEFSKKLILDFKFHDRTDLASLLAKMMYVAGSDIFAAGIDVIVPVPLHYTRLLKRRYNQSALLARELGRLSGVKVCCDAVAKIKMTRPQAECSGAERLSNVKDVFAVKRPEEITGKRVLLIDDVLTTGATLTECGKAVRRARPKSLDNLTAARAL